MAGLLTACTDRRCPTGVRLVPGRWVAVALREVVLRGAPGTWDISHPLLSLPHLLTASWQHTLARCSCLSVLCCHSPPSGKVQCRIARAHGVIHTESQAANGHTAGTVTTEYSPRLQAPTAEPCRSTAYWRLHRKVVLMHRPSWMPWHSTPMAEFDWQGKNNR